MKSLALLLVGFGFQSQVAIFASEPRGNLMELHSCELYAGGCTVSSESTLGGRYMLRAWNFTGGNFAGVDLAGLRLALLQSSPENLAAANSKPGQAVAYLPASATPAQREALLAWLKSAQPDLKEARLATRTLALKFGKEGTGYIFSAGEFLTVQTAPLESCDAGCGESLWYTPRTPTTVFTVAVDQSSQVDEPLLKVKWVDAGKRSIFLAKFGAGAPAKEIYVTTADLCGSTERLF